MPKPFTPKVVTASDLLKGHVIYQTADGWSPDIAQAEVLLDEANADLRLLEASQQTERVIGPYLISVTLDAGLPQPEHFREVFRANGPDIDPYGNQLPRA